MGEKHHKAGRIALWITIVAVLLVCLYIIVTGTGLDKSLDFGAGAYYYTDIPEFEKIVNNESYSPAISTPLAIFLFLAWGAFAYWLWKKIG